MTTLSTNTLSIGASLCNLFARNRGYATQSFDSETSLTARVQPERPMDLREQLSQEIGRLGTLQDSLGGFQIKTDKPLAFPFGQILTVLAARKFKVTVWQRDQMLVIEARP